MNCPKCGSNISWRDPKCPYCGAVNPAQKKERSRRRRRRKRARPILFLAGIGLLVLLIMLIVPKKDKKKDPAPTETAPVVTTQPTTPTETEAPTTLETAETTPDGEVVIDPGAYSSPAEFASSAAVREYMRQNTQSGDGSPARYAICDLNGDGTKEILVVSGDVDGMYDTLLFTQDYHLSAAISSYGEILLDPDENAIAYQPFRPQGTLEDGNYSGGHSFYKLHAASGALYPMYSIGVDEGVPLKDMGGVTQTITLEAWQEAINALLPVVWLSIV